MNEIITRWLAGQATVAELDEHKRECPVCARNREKFTAFQNAWEAAHPIEPFPPNYGA